MRKYSVLFLKHFSKKRYLADPVFTLMFVVVKAWMLLIHVGVVEGYPVYFSLEGFIWMLETQEEKNYFQIWSA